MSYLLPRTDDEARRLAIQSELLREGTERLLDALALRPGASCLDIGCGTGDALALIARRVGPTGRVAGLDLDPAPARARGVDVIAGDLFGDPALDPAGYDLVFSRYVLHHMPDPAAALARMWQRVRTGGVLAVLDIDQRGTATCPAWAPYDQLEAWIAELYARIGIDNRIGHKLPHLLERAAGPPDGTQVTGVIRTIAELAELLPLLLDMVRDPLIAHGVASAADVARLAAELATAAQETAVWCYRPTLVAVWRRKR